MTEFITGGPPRYRHQRQGLRKIIDTGGRAALLFDPGTGKTATALDYCALLALKAPSREARVLVVCPLAAVDTWVEQAAIFLGPQISYWAEALGGSLEQRAAALASRGGDMFKADAMSPAASKCGARALHHERSICWRAAVGGVPVDEDLRRAGPDIALGDTLPRLIIEVLNIDSFSSRAPMGSKGRTTVADYMAEAVQRFRPDLMVVDESHRIKGAMGNASRLLARIAQSVPRRLILTGTVMPHSPLDVFGQWRFLEPYAFGRPRPDGTLTKATVTSFKSDYALMGGYMGYQVVGWRNLDQMQEVMSRSSVVARKADALDLPKTTDTVVHVEMSPEEKRVYEEMRRTLAARVSSGALSTAPNRLSQMMRLRQITSGFLPDDNGSVRMVGRSKADTICSIIGDNLAGEKRIVVFCQFLLEVDTLVQRLSVKGTEVMRIVGETPAPERQAMRHRFGSDAPERMVLVCQIRTMSLAVNELVTANHAIFGSLSYQRDDFVQARDRLDRIGQTRPVTFWYAVAPGTVDTVIMQSHQDRTDVEAAVLDHIMRQPVAAGRRGA